MSEADVAAMSSVESVVDPGERTIVRTGLHPVAFGGALGMAISVVFGIALLWPGICVAGKRWHDRGKSAWWMLISIVPIVGLIWVFVENGCLRGAVGPNAYGPDPLLNDLA